MKKLLLFLLLSAVTLLQAAGLPALRDLNNLELHFLPDTVGKTVEFNFEKQDFNGYSGTDAIVCTLMSPSGKTVWESAVPDDGNISNSWQNGPRQSVQVKFTPAEKGIYVMKFNTSSSDIQMWFDNAQAKNTAWGFVAWALRFSGGNGIKGYLLMPPLKLGESQTQIMQLCTTRHSKVANVNITSLNGKKLISNLDLPHNEKMTYHALDIKRIPQENIYCFEADKFVNVVRFILPQYGNIMFFADADSAKKFEKLFSIKGELLNLSSNKKYPPIALGSKRTFQVASLPEKQNSKFDFTVNIAGQQVRLSDQQPSAFITTPAGDYHAIDSSAAAACKVQLIPAAAAPDALLPENGCTASDKDELVWSAVVDAKGYNLELKNVSTGKTLKHQLKNNRFPVSKLTHGVWQWSVNVNGKSGRKALITIPEKAETNLAYFYDFAPKMDITLDKAPEELASRIGLLKVDDIDFARSYVLVNGKKYTLKKLSSTRIESPDKITYRNGRNQIQMVVYSKSGVRSDAYWGFFIADKMQMTKFTHDKNGRIFCSGTPFYPMIYYGYMAKELAIERCGFNTQLGNTLPSRGNMQQLLQRNLKLLDSGSVYYGIYSKPKTAEGAEKDVKRIAANGGLRHPARLGAWMDEMDVHRSVKYIENYLKLFGGAENGWRGVCSCNQSLYKTMADMGDFLMIDHYGFGKTIFSTDAATLEGRVAAGNKPLMSLVKGFSNSDPELTGFIPGPRDVEYAAFSTLRNRANALGLYQCGTYRLECYPASWEHATNVYKRASALTFALYGSDADDLVSAKADSGKVGTRTMRYGNALYIIAQNASFTPGLFEFAVKNSADQKVRVLFENRVLELKNGKFADAFTSEATHIYYIELK